MYLSNKLDVHTRGYLRKIKKIPGRNRGVTEKGHNMEMKLNVWHSKRDANIFLLNILRKL